MEAEDYGAEAAAEEPEPERINYQVCHDGSQASIDALNVIHKGLLKPVDHMAIGHCWKTSKEEYLPYNMKLDYIRE